jgi:propanediol dehydratase small subunit
MTDDTLSAADYPVAETRPERVRGARGKTLDELTLEAAVSGDLTMEDLRITPQALLQQAQIARAVGRASLAANFERAAEMTGLPQDEVMHIYEMLRPGRAPEKLALIEAAKRLRDIHQAPRLAEFVEEAADVYHRRGLFRTRF